MAKTLMMLGAICLLATVLMFDFIVVIPKFSSKYFGAPDDIKEMASKMPDQPAWVNALGVLVLVAGFAGVVAVLVWAVRDTFETKMSFWDAFLRFLILFEGYKLFDVVCFDYLMLTKLKLPLRVYPETAGFKAYDSFGFNAKSQISKAVAFAVIKPAHSVYPHDGGPLTEGSHNGEGILDAPLDGWDDSIDSHTNR